MQSRILKKLFFFWWRVTGVVRVMQKMQSAERVIFFQNNDTFMYLTRIYSFDSMQILKPFLVGFTEVNLIRHLHNKMRE